MNKTSVATWTNNKEEFINMVKDGEWFITSNNNLFDESYIDNDDVRHTVIDSFIIGDPGYSTGRLREYCAELYPEIDFDGEFDTEENPGVFGRFLEKFGDAGDYIQNSIYQDIVTALEDRGYALKFND